MGHTCDECKYKRMPEDKYPCCKCWDADKFEPEEYETYGIEDGERNETE